MSDFLTYCREFGFDPVEHLTRSQGTWDLVPQPDGDRVTLRPSSIHGQGVFPTDWVETGQEIGLLLDRSFRRTATLGRYINHSANPTGRMRPIYSRGVVLIAARPLLLDDEITINYRDVEVLRGAIDIIGGLR